MSPVRFGLDRVADECLRRRRPVRVRVRLCAVRDAEIRVFVSGPVLIGSPIMGATATLGERGVSACLAAGNPPWRCYTEQHGFNPQWNNIALGYD
ncbi:hypothetical protein EVAR_36058_1 [Eumeta japonica]|uniref:Uncharacterized protein n=1 Tax=Eumeta variegata TaxID=151549 RepID=A0A4C1WQN4_EUMVA|nr:hypothetical protein EVAR_36058_1 [Eumeta japonica]